VRSGVSAFEGGRRAEAMRDLRQARDGLRALHKAAPGNRLVAGQLAVSLGFLGSVLRDEHRPAEAIASFKEARQVLEAIRAPAYMDLYNLACVYANLSATSDPASTQPVAGERQALAD